MKKIVYAIPVLIVCLLTFVNISIDSQQERLSKLTLANADAMASGESGEECRWRKAKCPGFLNFKTYEACTFDGDGNNCTCGETTRQDC